MSVLLILKHTDEGDVVYYRRGEFGYINEKVIDKIKIEDLENHFKDKKIYIKNKDLKPYKFDFCVDTGNYIILALTTGRSNINITTTADIESIYTLLDFKFTQVKEEVFTSKKITL